MAFRTCAAICFKEAFMKAVPVLLEPLMKIEVNTPDDYIGDIIGDLNRRRGTHRGHEALPQGRRRRSTASCRSMEMFGYATTLRNISSGSANYSMEFSKYVPLSRDMQEKTLKALEEKRLQKA